MAAQLVASRVALGSTELDIELQLFEVQDWKSRN
jgi:hypothetical protein